MKHVGDLTQPSEPSAPTRTTPKAIPQTWIAALFAKLQVRYGHKWSSFHPTDEMASLAMDEWRSGLAGLTGEQIKQGLETWEGEWPPSLPEFKQACIGSQAGLTHNTAAYKFSKKALPKPKADPEIVKAELAKMREVIQENE